MKAFPTFGYDELSDYARMVARSQIYAEIIRRRITIPAHDLPLIEDTEFLADWATANAIDFYVNGEMA